MILDLGCSQLYSSGLAAKCPVIQIFVRNPMNQRPCLDSIS